MTAAEKRLYAVMTVGAILFLTSNYYSIAVNSLSLGLMAVCWLGLMIVRKRFDAAPTSMDWYFLAFILAEAAATALSLDPWQSLYLSRRVLLIAIVYFFATHVREERDARRAVAVLLGAAAIVAAIGVVKTMLPRPPGDSRLGIFQFYMTTSELMMMSALLIAPFLLHPGTPRRIRWIALWAFLPIIFALYATVTRGAYLAAAAGLLFIVIMRDRRLIIPLVVVLVAAAVFSPPYIHDRIVSIFDLHHPENVGRQVIWKAGLKIFADHPVTGVGDIDLGQLLLKYQDVDTGEHWGHLHNVVLHILVTLGALGLIAYLAMMARALVVEWRLLRLARGEWFRESFITGAIALMIGFHVMGLTEWSFGDQEVVIMVWISLGLAIGIGRLPRTDGGDR